MRTEIAVGRLAAGVRLFERELIANWGVSRTVVREAMKQLEAEGLVSFSHSAKGATVRDPSPEEERDRYWISVALLGLAARLFIERASLVQRKALLLELRRLIEVCGHGGPTDAHDIDGVINVILDGASSTELSRLFERNRSVARLCSRCEPRAVADSRDMLASLTLLMDAFRSGNAEEAQRALRLGKWPGV
jgi:DNA-binding GntR family transcriptional regulator